MMMFLAKMIEEQKETRYSEVLGFIDDFKHMPKAVRGKAGKVVRGATHRVSYRLADKMSVSLFHTNFYELVTFLLQK